MYAPRGGLLTVALICTSLAVILMVVGFVTPGWQYIVVEGAGRKISQHTGLWYITTCVDSTCDTRSDTVDDSKSLLNVL